MTEDQLQTLVVQWLAEVLPTGSVFHHSPNEGNRHVAYKARLKKLGMRSGWPDIEIFVPKEYWWSGQSVPIFLELKAPKRGTLSANQKVVQDELIRCGSAVATLNSLKKVKGWLSGLIELRRTTHSQILEKLCEAQGG